MEIVYFTLDDGTVYAKGFFNQEGHSFYALPGYACRTEDRILRYLGPDTAYCLEILKELPGPSLCPPKVP